MVAVEVAAVPQDPAAEETSEMAAARGSGRGRSHILCSAAKSTSNSGMLGEANEIARGETSLPQVPQEGRGTRKEPCRNAKHVRAVQELRCRK